MSQTGEQCVRKISQIPPKAYKQESRAVFLGMDVTSGTSQQKRFANRPGQFVASQLRKRKVGVSVKNLSHDECRQLEPAKQNERRQYLQNEVMEALKGNEEIRDDELMGMRCVVTVKQFPERKVKARLVILGYQAGDLEDELFEADVVQSAVSCKWPRITVSCSRRQTSWELSCQYHCRKNNYMQFFRSGIN